jgi:hypothetical protein
VTASRGGSSSCSALHSEQRNRRCSRLSMRGPMRERLSGPSQKQHVGNRKELGVTLCSSLIESPLTQPSRRDESDLRQPAEYPKLRTHCWPGQLRCSYIGSTSLTRLGALWGSATRSSVQTTPMRSKEPKGGPKVGPSSKALDDMGRRVAVIEARAKK